MILNRAAIDRGLARGYVYKTEVLDLKEDKGPVRFAVPKAKPARGGPPSDHRPSTIFGQIFPQNLATPVSRSSCRAELPVEPQVEHAMIKLGSWPGRTLWRS